MSRDLKLLAARLRAKAENSELVYDQTNRIDAQISAFIFLTIAEEIESLLKANEENLHNVQKLLSLGIDCETSHPLKHLRTGEEILKDRAAQERLHYDKHQGVYLNCLICFPKF